MELYSAEQQQQEHPLCAKYRMVFEKRPGKSCVLERVNDGSTVNPHSEAMKFFLKIFKYRNTYCEENERDDSAKECRFEREILERKAELLCSLDHPNICKLHEFVQTKKTGYMVLEYTAMSLKEFLTAILSSQVNSQSQLFILVFQMWGIFRDLLGVLDYIHSFQLAHEDITLENVHLDTQGRVKLSCLEIHEDRKSNNSECYDGQLFDVYSLGCILDSLLKVLLRAKDPTTPIDACMGYESSIEKINECDSFMKMMNILSTLCYWMTANTAEGGPPNCTEIKQSRLYQIGNEEWLVQNLSTEMSDMAIITSLVEAGSVHNYTASTILASKRPAAVTTGDVDIA
eukprot:Nk52_evm6s332 gene=Nk52_evmTU6s332